MERSNASCFGHHANGRLDSGTHGELTACRRYLVATSDTAVRRGGSEHLGTNLIPHHGVANILDQTVKPIHILGGVRVRKPFNAASPFQLDEVLENIF